MIIRTDPRNLIIIVLAIIIFLLFDGCSRIGSLFSSEEVVATSTKTTTTYEVKDRSYQNIQAMPDYFTPVKVHIIYRDRIIKEIPIGDSIPLDAEWANKYEDIVKFPNGIVRYNILARGEILKMDLTLKTKDSIITNTTETINNVVQSGLFGFGGSVIGLDGRIKAVQTGVTYMRKNNWYLKGGLQYDVDPIINLRPDKRVGLVLEFGFKL